MELLDTPNPNAKKIVLDDSNNLNDQSLKSDISDDLYKIDGVDSVFFSPVSEDSKPASSSIVSL